MAKLERGDRRPLGLDQSYHCPICGTGTLSAMVLMDAYACNFCRHLFEASIASQIITIVDSSKPMQWRWSGRQWRSVNSTNEELTWLIWAASGVLWVLPSGIVWLLAYIFPPLQGLRWNSFPIVWGDVTFVVHGAIALWLLFENYQWPPYIRAQMWLQGVQEAWFD